MATQQVKSDSLQGVVAVNYSFAARVFGVSTPTIARWVADGKLTETNSVRGFGRYVTGASVRALLKKRSK